jgi:hypothetical protein
MILMTATVERPKKQNQRPTDRSADEEAIAEVS